jgi:hypothetical protein
MMVNIEMDSAYNGDEVILVGESPGGRIRVEDLAEWAGTNPYEILTNINTRVPRVYSSCTSCPDLAIRELNGEHLSLNLLVDWGKRLIRILGNLGLSGFV